MGKDYESTVDVVTVTYNSPPLGPTFELIASTPGMRLIVVDNASPQAPRIPLSATLIINEENVGFARACNKALEIGDSEYLLFLNPDCIVTPEAITSLVNSAQSVAPGSVIVSPQALGAPGQRVLPAGREPSARAFMMQYLGIARWLGGGFNIYTRSRFHAKLIDVDWVGGGCLLVSRQLFSSLHGFDERYFMYGEDIDLCLRARETGARILLDTQLTSYHPIGTGSVANTALRMAWLRNLRDIVLRRRGSFALARLDLSLKFGAMIASILRPFGHPPSLGRPDLRMLRDYVMRYPLEENR